jgi:hypothetical protein
VGVVKPPPGAKEFFVKNVWKAVLTVAACAAFSTPAAAQLSGFVSLDGPQFGARVGLNYAANLNSTTTLALGVKYNVFFSGNPTPPSSASVFVAANTLLSDRLSVGARLTLGLSGIGASNTFSVGLRPNISYIVLSADNFAVAATLYLETTITPSFSLQPWLALDATYLSGPLKVDFGTEADFTVVPGFSFDALLAYLHANYQLSDRFGVFAGASVGLAGGQFGLSTGLLDVDYRGVYGGLSFGLSNSITVRGLAGYFGGFNFTVTAAFGL